MNQTASRGPRAAFKQLQSLLVGANNVQNHWKPAGFGQIELALHPFQLPGDIAHRSPIRKIQTQLADPNSAGRSQEVLLESPERRFNLGIRMPDHPPGVDSKRAKNLALVTNGELTLAFPIVGAYSPLNEAIDSLSARFNQSGIEARAESGV